MKINGIDNGTVTGLVESFPFVGLASGTLNNEQSISDVNTFISTWKTNAAVATTSTVELPLMSIGTYNFWVDWGDGRKDYVTSYNQIYVRETVARTHTYRTVGTYTIKITGIIRGWSYGGVASEQPKIRSIQQFGCLELINGDSQFANCANLDLSNVKDTLSTKFLTSFQILLATSPNIGNVNLINNWNVRNVTNMVAVFFNDTSFNAPIGNWDVSSVTTMLQMFYGASAFNQPIDNWSLSSLTTTNQMFNGASSFNQPIDSWNLSTVNSTPSMFQNATAFNQPLNSWNVSAVTGMSSMFSSAIAFNQPIGSWNVGTVNTMSSMFFGATNFNQPIGSWNVSSVANMSNMFQNATNFNQDIGAWNIGAVTNFTSFMVSKTPATFSATNLDSIYNGWSSRPSNSNLSISFGTAKYTAASSAGRAILVSRGWTIVDGGI